jgi:hypothetical protein
MLPASAFGFTREDHIFADFLIRELRYHDTALRWLQEERKKTSDKKALAEIDSYIILCYQGQKGKEAEAERAIADFKKNYPDHVRSAGGDLESLVGEVAKVVDLLEKALRQADEKKAAELTAEALRIFDANVDRPLEASIKDFEDQISAAKKAEQKKGREKEKAPSGPKKTDEKLSNLLLSRDKAELARIKIHLSVARKLPASHARRAELLEKGRGLARSFVDERFEFFVMQYDAQLQVGIYSFEMGKHAEAMQELKILFDAEPPVAPPFSEDMVAVFKDFRLQSMLFAARALTASKQADQAAEVIRKHVLTATPGQFDLSKAEDDPRLKQLAVLVRLEHGIALAASGKGRQGLDVIQGVIAKYSKLGQAGEAFVTDARKALGRIAGLGGVTLRAQDYYQAAVGLKSELRIEESLEMFKTALASLNPRNAKEMGELAPLCLNEIGELYFFFLKSPLEAALAYEELSRHHFPKEGELATRVARNFLASIRRAIDATPGAATHAGLNRVKEAAEARSRGLDEGFDVYLSMMADAARLEEQGKFREARQKYLEVPKMAKERKVPFYWRAQASRWKCVVAEYEAAKEKERLEPDLAKASGELEKIIPLALADQDLTGAALASLTLGQIHFQAGKHGEAAAALAHFRKDLAEEPLYRCFGLGYLVLAETRVDDCAQAESDFEILHGGDCAKEALVAPVALDLSDCFERAGDAAKAGRYMLVYAEHPASKDDLEKFETVLVVVNRLIRGGHEKEARAIIKRFIEKTKQDPKLVDGEELARRIIIWDVRIAAYAKKWDEVIEKLEAYKTKYPPAGDHPEDPYIQRDLGEAYLGRVQESGGRDAQRRAEDLEKAATAYNNACGLLNNIRKFDPSVEKTFWRCLLRFMEIQMLIGNAASYRAVVSIVTASEKTGGDMGGLKEEFLKLANEARAKLGSPAASAGSPTEPRPSATTKPKARSKPKAKPKPKASATP